MAQNKCVVWGRVSSHSLLKGLQYQKDKCVSFAKENGYTIVDYFFMIGSHKNVVGDTFHSMMRLLTDKQSNVKTLLITNIDRFSRDASLCKLIFSDLLESNVTVIETDSGMRSDEPAQLLMLQLKLCMAVWDKQNRGIQNHNS